MSDFSRRTFLRSLSAAFGAASITDLMKPDAVDAKWVSEGDQQFFENVWTIMREKCFWRDRPINTN